MNVQQSSRALTYEKILPYPQPVAAPRGHQPADPALPGQDVGGALHQGARPPLQVLHPRQLRRPHRHGIHPNPHGETVRSMGAPMCLQN